MSKVAIKIIQHPDKDEIIGKLGAGIPSKDIHDWLELKYSAVKDNKYIIAPSGLETFRNEYLDFYNEMNKDIQKIKDADGNISEEKLDLTIKNDSAYKKTLKNLANKQLNVETLIVNMVTAIETRAAQIFDQIQDDPSKFNVAKENTLLAYFDRLGAAIERHCKINLNKPDQVIELRQTTEYVDQYALIFQEAVREVLAEMDVQKAMLLMEKITEKVRKLKPESQGLDSLTNKNELKLTEVHILNENINTKLNE